MSVLCPILNCRGSTKKKTKFKPRRSLCSDSRTQHSKKRGLKTAHDPKELITSFSALDTLTWKDSNMGSQMIFCQGK